jgi:hypothetical protein
MSTDIQAAGLTLQTEIESNQPCIAGLTLQTEIESNQPCIAGLTLQTEIGVPDIQIAGLTLQVEIEEGKDQPSQLDYEVFEGQYCKIYIDNTLQFTGVIDTVDKELLVQDGNKLSLDVSVTNLKNIPSRRTIKVNYDIGDTTDDIVKDMINSYLYQEGIEEGTISAGIALGEEWIDDCISVAEILDQCAEKNGFQWFIDKDMKLHFYQDPDIINAATNEITDDGEFKNYRNIRINSTIDNYVNKSFIIGGSDSYGSQVFSIRGDIDKQNHIQDYAAGSGVYGLIDRDGSNVEFAEHTAEVGTNETNIKITGHGLVVGDFVYNFTRNATTFVTAVVDVNNVTVESITSQTDGDYIIWYPSALAISTNTLKRQGYIQKTLTFETFSLDFEPATMLKVQLARYGISESYWNIENVQFSEVNKGEFICTITAVLRDENNFSTQKRPNSLNFFKGF